MYLLIALAMELVLFLPYLVAHKAFAFYDIGSDTFLCFYPLQVAVSRQLHALYTFTWSFNLGLGGFIGTLFDPLGLITGWLPDSWQLGLRLPMFGLRILLGGGFFYGYLRTIGLQTSLAVVGGLAYAFCSYALINVQWEVMHGTEFMQFAVFLFLLERYLRGGSRWTPVAAGIVIGIGHPMGVWMFGLFGLTYAAIRLSGSPASASRPTLAAFFRFAGWCAVGLFIAAPILFPALYYLFESPRVTGDHSQLAAVFAQVFSINDRPTIASEVAGLLGKDLLGTGTNYKGWGNYFEGPGFYVGLLPLICIPQLLGPKASRRERLLCIVAIVGIGLYFLFPALRSAVYGFGESTFRFSTLWISVLLLVLGLFGLQRILLTGLWLPGAIIGITGVLSIAIGAAVLIPQIANWYQIAIVLVFSCIHGVFLFLLRNPNRSARWIAPLVAVFACELMCFAIPPVVLRDAVNLDTSSPIGSYVDGTEHALSFVREYNHRISPDDNFYRIEKAYYSVFLDDSLVQGYPGTASYFFHGTSITRFVDQMDLQRVRDSANYINSMAGRREILDLLAVKYVVSRDRSPESSRDFSYIGDQGGIRVYKNDSARDFGQFFDEFISESQVHALAVPARDGMLLTKLAVPDPAAIKAELTSSENGNPQQPDLQRNARIKKIFDNRLEGTVATPTASAFMLPMPFDRGWSATLDGKPLALFRADFGLTAAILAPGRHTLSMSYSPPGRSLGLWSAGATICLLLLLKVAGRNEKARTAPRRMFAKTA